ncbi:MAG: DUF2062 domain-containing protein [Campylobacterota bacterium]|nr:DUF2062 domain-containing protein [Campylobacterota bacterium]
MIRNIFKKTKKSNKFDKYIKKYNISTEFMSVNRKMVSRAALVGFFVAFIPMPLQMVAVIAVLPFFKFNALIGIAIVWITNPFTMPIIYYVEYITGNALLMRDSTLDIEISIKWFSENLDAIFIPLYTGALFYSTLSAIFFYYLVNWLWVVSVRKERKDKKS